MSNLRRLGQEAEDRAAQFLMDKGFTLVSRRVSTRRGEIDLIAMDGDTMVFVEVKFRQAKGYFPEESVGKTKLGRMRAAAQEYVAKMEVGDVAIRFDLIAIDSNGVRHHVDVFSD